MSEWKECTIGDLGKIITGKTPRTAITENYGGKVPFLSPSDNMKLKYVDKTNKTLTEQGVDEVKNCLLPANAVCVSCIGSDLGKVLITTQPTVTNQQINSIIVNEDNDTDFIYYLMTIVGKHLNFISKTSTAVPIINKTTFSNYKISVPLHSEQKKIAAILSSLDEKIETNRKINARLEELAQALFKSWFIDFEPFGGKMPENWELTPLDKIVDNIGGYSYKGHELQRSDVAMVTIKNFDRNGSFRLDGFKEIVISSKCKPEQHASKFDVLVAHTDLTQNADIIGNPVLILSTLKYNDLVYSMDLTKIVSKNPSLSNFIIYHILKTKDFKGHALGYVNGTTVLHMSKKAVPEYEIYLPLDLTILRPLQNTLKSIYEHISVRIDEIARLEALRDTLQPKLMSGELIPE